VISAVTAATAALMIDSAAARMARSNSAAGYSAVALVSSAVPNCVKTGTTTAGTGAGVSTALLRTSRRRL
jgi:hypothetical protein